MLLDVLNKLIAEAIDDRNVLYKLAVGKVNTLPVGLVLNYLIEVEAFPRD
jgi:hypothetical protein